MGARRTELAMSVFGRSYGRDITGRVFVRGREVRARTVAEAIDAGIAYATEDRKKYGLNLIDDSRRNVSAAARGKLSRRGWVDGNEETRAAEDSRRDMAIKAPSVMSVVGTLSGGNQQKVVLANGSQPAAGNMFELDAIAAAFIGGAAVTGGVGTVVGAMVGGLIMAVMSNGMQLMGVDQSIQSVVKGLVLLLAVAFDVYDKRRAGAAR